MAVPTYYTELALAEFAHQELRDLAEVVGWSVANNSYTELINDTLLILAITDLAGVVTLEALDTLRAVTRREVWRAILRPLSARYHFRSNLQDFAREQMHKMAVEEYERAALVCADKGIPTPGVTLADALTIPVVYIHDPYGPTPYNDAELRIHP